MFAENLRLPDIAPGHMPPKKLWMRAWNQQQELAALIKLQKFHLLGNLSKPDSIANVDVPKGGAGFYIFRYCFVATARRSIRFCKR